MRRVPGAAGRGVLLCALLVAPDSSGAPAGAAPAMVGPPGVDADGYPRQTADKRAALRLLRARKFDALEAWLVDLQAQFEDDYHKEYWPIDALDAFSNVDPALEPLLDAWVAAKPSSYMALAARGIHQESVGWFRRGAKWACDTPPENFEAMREAHLNAFPDLDDALVRHPKLIAVHRALIKVATANGAPLPLKRQLLEQAILQCPDCFQVRVALMMGLQPRWGGSHEEMLAFARESIDASRNVKAAAARGLPLRRCVQHPSSPGQTRRIARRLQPRAGDRRISGLLRGARQNAEQDQPSRGAAPI